MRLQIDSDDDYPNALIYPDRYEEKEEDRYIEDDGINLSGQNHKSTPIYIG